MALELEYKFAFAGEPPAESALSALLRPEGLAVERRARREQRDRYFDSAEGALTRAGVALRLRCVGRARLVTLKRAGEQQGGLHRREELELPFVGAWPAEVRAALRGLADLAVLAPVMEIDTERRPYLVKGEKALAELAFDRVRARFAGAAHGGGEVAFGEVELEALTADAETLARLAGALQRALALSPSALSKLERARTLLEAERAGA